MSFPDPHNPTATSTSPVDQTPPDHQAPPDKNQRMWVMLCHLSALAGLVVPVGGNVIGPLIVWLVKKDEIPMVDDQGKEALNFQISLTIYLFVLSAISGILTIIVIGFVLLIAVLIAVPLFGLVMAIIASLEANRGIAYRYPLCIRLIS